MSIDKFMLKTDFLPPAGLIFVDTCGINWVCPSDSEIAVARRNGFRRMRGFRREFERRGNILAIPGVLAEIEYGLDVCVRKVASMTQIRRNAKRAKGYGTYAPPFSKGDLNDVKNRVREYNSMLEVLRANQCTPGVCVSPKDVRAYVDKKTLLSPVDKDIVSSALIAGNRTGILSADIPLLWAYRNGIKEFGLRDAFICDAIRGETIRGYDWTKPERIVL